MDKIDNYKEIIRRVFAHYADTRVPANDPNPPGYQLIFDEKNEHYLLYRTAWKEFRRVHFCVFHIDIINNK